MNGARISRPGEPIATELRQRSNGHRIGPGGYHEGRTGLAIGQHVVLLAFPECDPVQIGTHPELQGIRIASLCMLALVEAIQADAFDLLDDFLPGILHCRVIDALAIR